MPTKRRITVEAVVFDPAGRVLLVRQGRRAGRAWELPGGKVKRREFILDAVVREVQEETGLAVEPQHLIAIYFISEENTHDFLIRCQLTTPADAQPRPHPPEIISAGFFGPDDLPTPIRPFTTKCIQDAMNGIPQPLPVAITADQWL
jgi:8-oxo-dGTP pyrophosphatase MutT (NUDIX family)